MSKVEIAKKRAEEAVKRAKQVEELENQKIESEVNSKLEAFIAASKVYDKGICLHTGPTPRYFRKDLFWDENRKTGVRTYKYLLTFFSANVLYPTYAELSTPLSRVYLRDMVEGGDLVIPGTNVTQHFESRKYVRLANNVIDNDPDTYNLLSLSNRLTPSGKEVKKCPDIIRALLLSLSGSEWVYEVDHFEATKQENMDWLERWIYGVVCADTGNSQLSTPVIFGGGKVGRNALADRIIPGILGAETCFTATWDIIDGNFNAFRYGKVFTFIDEVPNREDWSKFKNMTGSPQTFVKEKYGPEVVVDNCITYMIGSNEDTYPLPLEDGKQMVRMSPIKVSKKVTFAESVVKVIGKNFVEDALHLVSVDTTGFDNYTLGDTYLKTFGLDWYGKDVLQEFLDYLHTKFGGSAYNLQPLRGRDWIDILKSKPDPINELAGYIVERNQDYVTIDELYEIYLVMSGTTRQRNYIKLQNTVVNNITPLLESSGYTLVEGVEIDLQGGGGVQTKTKVFKKNSGTLGIVKNDYSKYIMEENIGSVSKKRLIYEKKTSGKIVPISGKFKI